jgi:plasmid stabilization system protein ParE
MTSRYFLAPQAAEDLVEIWRYIKERSSLEVADRVESVIRQKFVFLATNPGAGHARESLTAEKVKFSPVCSHFGCLSPRNKSSADCFDFARRSRRRTSPSQSPLAACAKRIELLRARVDQLQLPPCSLPEP